MVLQFSWISFHVVNHPAVDSDTVALENEAGPSEHNIILLYVHVMSLCMQTLCSSVFTICNLAWIVILLIFGNKLPYILHNPMAIITSGSVKIRVRETA